MPCDVCGQIFENPVVLNKHKYAKHVKLLKLKVKKECQICRKMITAHVMNRHIQGMPFNSDFFFIFLWVDSFNFTLQVDSSKEGGAYLTFL